MECFKDYSVDRMENKGYAMIPRREFNPEISAFSNLLLDLVDFKDRVRPMANDIARHDAAHLYQKRNVEELQAAMDEFKEGITEGTSSSSSDPVAQSVEEGYSSLEIAAESGAEDAAEPDFEAVVEDTPSEAEGEEKEEDSKKE